MSEGTFGGKSCRWLSDQMTAESWGYFSQKIQAFVSRPLYDHKVVCSKDSSYPRISVVVPSYNQGQFLERTILSILNQNYPNTELIIVDGGSRDGTAELLKKYDVYISYWVSEPDKGQPSAINKGFERASGDLIGWQNADDLYLPGFFHTVAESFWKYSRGELFFGNIYTIDEDDEILSESRFPPFSLGHLIYLDWNLSSQAIFITPELIDKVGPLREDIQVAFDWDWFIRVGKVVKHTVLHRRYGGCYRIHSASKFSTHSRESRWMIEAQILNSHGIRVREELPYNQQLWWKTTFYRLRRKCYAIVLYSQNPVLRRSRPVILWCLEKLGITCRGFE